MRNFQNLLISKIWKFQNFDTPNRPNPNDWMNFLKYYTYKFRGVSFFECTVVWFMKRVTRIGFVCLYSFRFGQECLTTTLLECGASPAARNAEQRTPLHLSCLAGHIEVCRKLLQVDSRKIDSRDIGGRTPLHSAAFNVIIKFFKYLNFRLQVKLVITTLRFVVL